MEFRFCKDIVNDLHTNSWSLRTKELEAAPQAVDETKAGLPAGVSKGKAKAKATGKAGATDPPSVTPGRGKTAEDLKLDTVVSMATQFKLDVEDGERFVRNAVGKKDDWDKLQSFVPGMQELLTAAEASLSDFGNKTLLHDKKALKTMYDAHSLATQASAFIERVEKPLSALQTYCKQVYSMKRAGETSHLGSKEAKRSRKAK